MVMSKFTHGSFDDNIPGCVRLDCDTFAKCIIDLHGNESQRTAMQKAGNDYISETKVLVGDHQT